MNTPLITWGCIVGLLIVILLVRIYRLAWFASKDKDGILGIMSEREEFFIPGDPSPRIEDEYGLSDFDDLW